MTTVISGTSGLTFPDNSTQAVGFYGFKNRVINGGMVIAQRGTGAITADTTDQFPVDRFKTNGSTSGKYTAQQNAGSVTPPAGFTNYLGCTSSSAYSVPTGEAYSINHIVEGYNVADFGWGAAGAQNVTLSFWVRCSLTGTFGGVARNGAGTRSYPFTFSISSANTWEQKTITITGDTSGTWLTTNGQGLILVWSLACGATYLGTAGAWGGTTYFGATGQTNVLGTSGATFYITGVQLEKGSTATSFDYRPYGTELALCQRYCVVQGGTTSNDLMMTGSGNTSVLSSQTFRPSVSFRAVPSLGYSALTDFQIQIVGGTAPNPTSLSLISAISSPQYIYLDCGIASGGVAGAVHFLRAANSNARLTFSAEL